MKWKVGLYSMSRTQKNVYIALLAAQAVVVSLIEGLVPNLLAFAPGAGVL